MLPDHARRIPVVVLALLALTAGCQSLSGPEHATATLETGSNDTETVRFLQTHERTLRRAGNVTVERWKSVREVNGPFDSTSNSTHRIDLTRGRVLLTSLSIQGGVANQAGIRHTYRTENGRTFVKSSDQEPLPIDVHGTISPLPVVNESQVTYRGEETVDGVEGSVYVVDSFDALDADAYSYLHPDNVTAFTVTYVVDERGYVAYQRVNRTVEYGDDTVRIRERVRFENVGSTTVARPEWAYGPFGNLMVRVPG